MKKQTITPFLWFNDNAEQAMKFYVSIFKDAKIISKSPVAFRLNGQEFLAINGGPHFQFTPAISLFIQCDTQAEIDELWEKLSKGGKKSQCGWLTDKFGISWQVVPRALGELMGRDDPKGVERVWEAMMGMKKLDIAGLEHAYENAPEKPAKAKARKKRSR